MEYEELQQVCDKYAFRIHELYQLWKEGSSISDHHFKMWNEIRESFKKHANSKHIKITTALGDVVMVTHHENRKGVGDAVWVNDWC